MIIDCWPPMRPIDKTGTIGAARTRPAPPGSQRSIRAQIAVILVVDPPVMGRSGWERTTGEGQRGRRFESGRWPNQSCSAATCNSGKNAKSSCSVQPVGRVVVIVIEARALLRAVRTNIPT